MMRNMTYYKMSTTISVNKEFTMTFFDRHIERETSYKNKEAYLCIDGSILIFHDSGTKEEYMLNFMGA